MAAKTTRTRVPEIVLGDYVRASLPTHVTGRRLLRPEEVGFFNSNPDLVLEVARPVWTRPSRRRS